MAPREVGSETQVAGRQLRTGMERELALDFLRQLGASAGRHAPGTGSGGARSGSPDGRGGRVDGPARRGGPSRGWLMGLAASLETSSWKTNEDQPRSKTSIIARLVIPSESRKQ